MCSRRSRGVLVVSEPDSYRSIGPGSSPGQGHLCCVLGQDTLLSQCLSPPSNAKYGYCLVNCHGNLRKIMLGATLVHWTNIPSRGSNNTPNVFRSSVFV